MLKKIFFLCIIINCFLDLYSQETTWEIVMDRDTLGSIPHQDPYVTRVYNSYISFQQNFHNVIYQNSNNDIFLSAKASRYMMDTSTIIKGIKDNYNWIYYIEDIGKIRWKKEFYYPHQEHKVNDIVPILVSQLNNDNILFLNGGTNYKNEKVKNIITLNEDGNAVSEINLNQTVFSKLTSFYNYFSEIDNNIVSFYKESSSSRTFKVNIFDLSGNLLNTQTIDSSTYQNDTIYSANIIRKTEDGGYYLRINYLKNVGISGKILFINFYKLDKYFNKEKNLFIKGSDTSWDDALLLNDGSWVVLGKPVLSINDQIDTINNIIRKYNSSGELEWEKLFGENKYDVAKGFIETNDGGFLLAFNYNYSDDSISQQYVKLIRLDSQGNFIWGKDLHFTKEDTVNYELDGLTKTSKNEYLILSSAIYENPDSGSNPARYYLTKIKDNTLPVINETVNETTIFPNPSTGFININFYQNNSSQIAFEIIDILGIVKKFQTVFSDAGNNTLRIKTDYLPSGSYFLILRCQGQVFFKKFIKL